MTRIVLLLIMFTVPVERAAAQIPEGMKAGLVEYLQGSYEGLKGMVTSTAERMPEADFGFRPGPQPHVRTFGQVVIHIAASQFSTCASLRGVPNPVAERDLENELASRAAVLRALAESFSSCDVAVASLSEGNLSEFVPVGRGHAARAAVITGLLAHTSQMYGVSTVYLRAKGIVPPASDR